MAVGDIIQTVIVSRMGQQLGLIVRHWRVATQLGSGATLTEIAEALRAKIAPAMGSLLSDQASFNNVTAQRIFPLPLTLAASSTGAATPGSQPGDPLPKQVAGLIRFRSEFAGRRQRSRAFVPFPAEGTSGTDASPSLPYITNLGTLASQLAEALSAGTVPNQSGLSPIIWHRDIFTYDQIVAYGVSAFWATQRRRGDFGRPNPGDLGIIIS